MTGICSSVLPKRRYFTGGGWREKPKAESGNDLRGAKGRRGTGKESRREQRHDLVDQEHDRQQQRAGNQARRTYDSTIHNFEIGGSKQDLSLI